MLQARRIKNNAVRGFTLVELLVTISIIGVLASITVVSVGNVRQIARDSKRLADIKQLQTALEFYFNQQNGYPAGTDITLGTGDQSVLCITADATRGFEDTVNDCAGNGAGPVYMSRVPSNPIPGVLQTAICIMRLTQVILIIAGRLNTRFSSSSRPTLPASLVEWPIWQPRPASEGSNQTISTQRISRDTRFFAII